MIEETGYDIFHNFINILYQKIFNTLINVCFKNRIISNKNISFYTFNGNDDKYGQTDFDYDNISIGINENQFEYEIFPCILYLIHIIRVMVHELLHAECIINKYDEFMYNMMYIKTDNIYDKNKIRNIVQNIANKMAHTGMWNNMMNDVANKYCIPIDCFDQKGEQHLNVQHENVMFYNILYNFLFWINEKKKYDEYHNSNDKNFITQKMINHVNNQFNQPKIGDILNNL